MGLWVRRDTPQLKRSHRKLCCPPPQPKDHESRPRRHTWNQGALSESSVVRPRSSEVVQPPRSLFGSVLVLWKHILPSEKQRDGQSFLECAHSLLQILGMGDLSAGPSPIVSWPPQFLSLLNDSYLAVVPAILMLSKESWSLTTFPISRADGHQFGTGWKRPCGQATPSKARGAVNAAIEEIRVP